MKSDQRQLLKLQLEKQAQTAENNRMEKEIAELELDHDVNSFIEKQVEQEETQAKQRKFLRKNFCKQALDAQMLMKKEGERVERLF